MTTQQERPFRNAHWTGDLAASGTRVNTRHYATRERAITDADTMAAAGESVHLEEWDAALADDPVNQGWGLYDRRDPHAPVTGDVTGTSPGLTPYDTGDRLEPHRWRERPDQPEHYGKVDFDDDESSTVATVHIEKTPAGKYRLVIETDFEFEPVSFNGESTLMQEEQS